MGLKKIKTKYIIVISALILIVIFLSVQIYIIFSNQQKPQPVEQVKPQVPPIQVVQEFYRWYMSYQGSPIESNAYKSMPQLTNELILDIEKRIADNRLNYDPFVCQVAKPLGVGMISQEIIEQNATVLINTDYGYNEQVSVSLQKFGDDWKIVSVNCPQIERYQQIDEDVERNRISVFLIDKNIRAQECNLNLVEVKKIPENISDPLGSAIRELFKGLSTEDIQNNYNTGFIKNGQEILRNVRIQPDKITITILNKDQYFANLTQCQNDQLIKQLENTVKYYGYDQEIVFE